MSATPDNLQISYSEQLSRFDSGLRNQVDDATTQQNLTEGIKALLRANAEGESDIRATLLKRLQDGHIREDTFRLVSSTLERILAQKVSALPVVAPLPVTTQDARSPSRIMPVPSRSEERVDEQVRPGSALRDRFQLCERVACGRTGIVYKAQDRQLADAGGLEPWVAVKVLNTQLASNPTAVRALQQEVAKARCLSHPNIVRIIDIERHNEPYFIVMEWLEGKSLATILHEGKGSVVDRSVTMNIVTQVGQALDYAHRCGVVHADIKPTNIIITPSGSAKLLDFGMARIRQQQLAGDPAFDPAVPYTVLPDYASMQVLTGETPVPADDVFSLACLMYRLAAGYRVFGPRNAAEAAQMGMAPLRPQRLGDADWSALRKALAYARVARFPTVRAFMDALSPTPAGQVSPDDTLNSVAVIAKKSPQLPIALGCLAILLTVAVTYTDVAERTRTFISPTTSIDIAAAPVIDTETAGEADVPPATIPHGEAAPVLDAQPRMPAEAEVVRPISQDTAVGVTPLAAGLPAYQPIDYSQIPPATLIIPLVSDNAAPVFVDLTLVENGAAAIVDLVRETGIDIPLSVHFDEVAFSGNRSLLETGQYRIAQSGVVRFVPGQRRARTELSMQPDNLREADRTATLVLRDGDSGVSQLATIRLRLEDDDQRAFEAGLQSNTVAFAGSRISVRESDPAAQVDVIRFNPGAEPLIVGYIIRGVTAGEGLDFFEPPTKSVFFGAGERSARILVPLVQDSEIEADEAFMLELIVDQAASETDLFRRIAVMIRDDDTPGL